MIFKNGFVWFALLQVQLEHGFAAAVQRDALLPRLKDVKPQQFADVAQAFAGVKVQMDKEVLDGFWQETCDKLDKLTGGPRGLWVSHQTLNPHNPGPHLCCLLEGLTSHIGL
jgi:hypothetical protein